jgi:hypothetical protein
LETIGCKNKKPLNNTYSKVKVIKFDVYIVGMRRFELPAPGPPDQYSNLAELHPELCAKITFKNLSPKLIA